MNPGSRVTALPNSLSSSSLETKDKVADEDVKGWREDREEKWMKPSRDSTLLSLHSHHLEESTLMKGYYYSLFYIQIYYYKRNEETTNNKLSSLPTSC